MSPKHRTISKSETLLSRRFSAPLSVSLSSYPHLFAYWLCGFVDAAAFVAVWKGKPLNPAPTAVLPTVVYSCCQTSSNTRRETGWMGSYAHAQKKKKKERAP